MDYTQLQLALSLVKLAALAGVLVPVIVGLARWATWRRS